MVYVKLQNSFNPPHITSVHRMSIHDGAGTLSSVSLTNFSMGSSINYMSKKNICVVENICRAYETFVDQKNCDLLQLLLTYKYMILMKF